MILCTIESDGITPDRQYTISFYLKPPAPTVGIETPAYNILGDLRKPTPLTDKDIHDKSKRV
jgi:hypothetical protein